VLSENVSEKVQVTGRAKILDSGAESLRRQKDLSVGGKLPLLKVSHELSAGYPGEVVDLWGCTWGIHPLANHVIP